MTKMKLRELQAMWIAKVTALGGTGADVVNAGKRFSELKRALRLDVWTTCFAVNFGGNGHHPWASQITVYIDIKNHGQRISSTNARVSIGGTSRSVNQMVSMIADLQRATELAAYADQLFDCEVEDEDGE